jgi:TPR repeat protein
MNEAIGQAKDAIEREDYDSATQILRPLADANDAEAQFLIGYLYFTSADVSKDDSRAWLQRAGAHGHPEALYYLACLGDGLDFGPPEDEARRVLLVRAAELGSAQAQRDLGCFYATGDDGFPKDEALGRLWYGRAAAQGHADAQYNYGCMLLYGEGGPADPATAKNLIRRAAAQGSPCAIHFIESCPNEIA